MARLARIDLTDEELDLYAGQLAVVLDHAAQVAALDTAGVEPTAHLCLCKNVAAPTSPGPRSTATRCWPRRRPWRTAASGCPDPGGRPVTVPATGRTRASVPAGQESAARPDRCRPPRSWSGTWPPSTSPTAPSTPS